MKATPRPRSVGLVLVLALLTAGLLSATGPAAPSPQSYPAPASLSGATAYAGSPLLANVDFGTRFDSIDQLCFSFTFKPDPLAGGVLRITPLNLLSSLTGAGLTAMPATQPTRTLCYDNQYGYSNITSLFLDGREDNIEIGMETGSITISSLTITAIGVATAPVADTTAPVLRVPADVAFDATSPAGAVVAFHVSASDDVDPAPVITCVPSSGSVFAIGHRAVTCTAKDAAGNSAQSSFGVVVRGAAEQLDILRSELAALGLRPAVASSLDLELRLAQSALAHNQPTVAGWIVGIFTGQVRALPAMSPSAAADLVAAGNRIRAVIG